MTSASRSREPRERTNLLVVASSLGAGGAEMVIRRLAEEVDRDRFEVTVCCLKGRGPMGPALASTGIDVVDFTEGAHGRTDYLTFLKMLRLTRLKRIDVLHTHETHGFVDAALCRMLLPNLRLVHTFHFGNYPHIDRRTRWMEYAAARVADRLLAVGEVQRQQVREVYRLGDGRIATVRNGVALPTGTGDPDFRRRVGANGRLLVGTIGNFIEQKGLEDLLLAARRVRDAGHDAVFVVVGDGHLRPALEDSRRRLGLEDSVVFTGWIVNAAEAVLPAFDIFFQPSLWEAMSVVVLEAMAACKPVVATTVGENPHVIDHEVDGLLVKPKDIDAMAAALIRLIDDPNLRQRYGSAARRKVERQFTVAHMARAYEQIYLDLLR